MNISSKKNSFNYENCLVVLFSLYSTVVVRRTCNAKVGGSIPPGGKFCRDSITVSIPACHAGDRGSIPRRGASNLKQKNVSCESWFTTRINLEEIAFESRMRPSGFDLYSKFTQRLLCTIFIAVKSALVL